MGKLIRNKKFLKALKENGLQDFGLVKADGYFYICGLTDEAEKKISEVENYNNSSSIYICNFNQCSVDDWIYLIKSFLLIF